MHRLPLQRVGNPSDANRGDGTESQEVATDKSVLDGFEDLEAVLSPETAAASKAAEGDATQSVVVGTPKAGVTLLGGLVTAQSKVWRHSTGHFSLREAIRLLMFHIECHLPVSVACKQFHTFCRRSI